MSFQRSYSGSIQADAYLGPVLTIEQYRWQLLNKLQGKIII